MVIFFTKASDSKFGFTYQPHHMKQTFLLCLKLIFNKTKI